MKTSRSIGHITDEDQPDTSIWVWAAWLDSPAAARFLYGCAARCTRATGWQGNHAPKDLLGAKLIIRQSTVNETVYENFAKQLDSGSLDLKTIFGDEIPSLQIAAMRQVLAASLGQTAARVTAHYTMPALADLLGNDETRLPLLLEHLEQELGLPFKSTHATRLGNFEWFDLNPWLDRSQPFVIEAVSADIDGGASVYRISRTSDFAAAEHKAHVVGRVNGDVIVDRLLSLTPGEQRLLFDLPERLDELEFRLFDVDGILLHSEKSAFMNRIGFVLSPIHRQIQIQDALSTRAGSGRKNASIVQAHSSMRSLVGAPKIGSWRKFAEDMAHAVALRAPTPSEDKWFSRGIEGELGAIAYLNKVLDGGSVRRAILVDPWFGVDALNQFALRLASVDVEITILTSWHGKDPDTGVVLDLNSPTEKLNAALEQVKPFIQPKLSVLNLVDGKEQAFHDRYLLLYPHEGLSKVFLLSNSLNAAGKNWPFSMSLMAADAAHEVRLYIEGLHNGQDITSGKPLHVNFRWSTHVQPASR